MRQEDREELERLYASGPSVTGDWGEILTASSLRTDLGLRVLRSLYIGGTQIDMVGIAPCGVLVIENKNYHGVVSGSLKAKYWSVMYPSEAVYQMYNPSMQNEKHCSAVRRMLSLMGHAGVKVFNIVVFNEATSLYVTDNDGSVMNLSDFVERYMKAKIPPVVGSDTRRRLEQLFEKYQDGSVEAKEAHRAMIARKMSGF